ncbi:3-phosphoshikimate 1-carboxyvinyltransferase [Psychromonas algarum]|uniref:3-phosphoshikimate 1-carboxyvinyltransferase n=1 Tax=Psychromonas algarum TaxID=2555643 RepID=UPI001FBAEF60|nr:3-phosphoshikimate 1-carboxyvinyltransferase [Psychromonas sp. RZ22]
MSHLKKNIKDEQAIKDLLSKMPKSVAESFSEEQLTHLFTIVSTRSWAKHSMDLRGTVKIPFYSWRFYYVFLIGKNVRELSRQEARMSLFIKALIITILLLSCTLLGILILYLIKSALGIDIFPHYSFGLWTWFKELAL